MEKQSFKVSPMTQKCAEQRIKLDEIYSAIIQLATELEGRDAADKFVEKAIGPVDELAKVIEELTTASIRNSLSQRDNTESETVAI